MSAYMMTAYDDWFDKRADLPTLDNYSVEPTIPIVVQHIKTQNTDELLSEFEAIYDAVELTHLTPPQTPPQHFNGTVLNQAFNYPELPQQAFQIILPTYEQNFPTKTSQQSQTPQQQCDSVDEVDEIIRSVSRDLPDFTDDDNSSGSVSNPSLSPRSEFSYSGSNYSQDDDWIPSTCSPSSLKESSSSAVSKRRPRPYARGTEDKKSRKKEQNKNAATRYRQKKKAEIDQILDVEKDLLDHHKKLYTKYKDVRREISYLKSLMRELFKSKGLLD